MSIESEFIDWINEHPDDVQTQLVYADWLEQHDETMAEAWRVLIGANKRPEYGFDEWSGWNWFPRSSYHQKFHGVVPNATLPDILPFWDALYFPQASFFNAMRAAAKAWVWWKETGFAESEIAGVDHLLSIV